jgi:hypothetical protein
MSGTLGRTPFAALDGSMAPNDLPVLLVGTLHLDQLFLVRDDPRNHRYVAGPQLADTDVLNVTRQT